MAFTMKNRTLVKLEKTSNSRNGNPRFRLTTDDGVSLYTKPDTMFAHSLVEGSSFMDGPVDIDINGRGHVESIRYAGEAAEYTEYNGVKYWEGASNG